MNWRALGCAVLAAGVFVGLGVWSLQLALDQPGCPPVLLWGNRQYTASGPLSPEPVVGEGEPVFLGNTLVGAVSRAVYGPEGTDPASGAEDLPDHIAVACGDGTYLTYRYSTDLPSLPPPASGSVGDDARVQPQPGNREATASA